MGSKVIQRKDSGNKIITAAFCLLLICDFAFGATLSIGNVRGYPGQTATVPVNLRGASNQVVAAQFDLAFDASKAAWNAIGLAPRLSNHVVRSREIAPGLRRVLVYSLANATTGTNNTFADATFTVAPNERISSGPLTPQNLILARADASTVMPLNASAGTIFVTPVYRDPASGIVSLFVPSEQDQRYLIQATTDFIHWDNIATNLAVSSFLDLVDADAPMYPHRFYRSGLFDEVVGGHLSSFTRLTGDRVSFRITALEGRIYTVQSSTNLVNWQDIAMFTATGGTVSFTNTMSSLVPVQFFRLTSQ